VAQNGEISTMKTLSLAAVFFYFGVQKVLNRGKYIATNW